jgi:(1->4)-alpha-D-glucan 1-alpha-D-glucosylmutase
MRARLNVLSEIPAEFTASVQRWAELSKSLKQKVDGEPAPDRAEEYFLYQTLLGAYPTNPTAQQQFPSRIAAYMVKALREAKRHSNWLNPNLPYETAVTAFTNGLLSNHDFLEVFLPLQQKVAFYGVYNSLSQTLLKITCPGIPDFYQGSELWDLALVDPDNRRPIDYTQRQTLLKEVTQIQPSKVPNLLKNSADGKIKLYLIQRALRCRRELHAVFEEGEYVPLAVRGFCAGNVVAFCRRRGSCYVLVFASRYPTELLKPDVAWGNAGVDWVDTYVMLPAGAPARWHDILTDQTFHSMCGRFPLRVVMGRFSVALLWGDDASE